MLQVLEVCILSIDKSEDTWAIEGEFITDGDINCAFEVSYLLDEDELEGLSTELNIEGLDMNNLKEKIIQALSDFDEE